MTIKLDYFFSQVIVFIWLLLIPAISFAQEKPADSLINLLQLHPQQDTLRVNTLLKLAEKLKGKENQKANNYANEALQLATSLGFKKGESESWLSLAKINFALQNYKVASENTLNAITIFKNLGDSKSAADTYLFLGSTYSNMVALSPAIENFFSALEIYEKLGDTAQQALCYVYVGFCNFYQENYEQSFTNFSKGLKLSEESGKNKSWFASQANIYLAKIYVIRKQYREAKYYNLLGLNMAIENDDLQAIANSYSTAGDLLVSQSEDLVGSDANQQIRIEYLDSALQNYLVAVEKARIFGDNSGLNDGLIKIAEIIFKLNNLPVARKYADSALTFGREYGAKDALMNGYKILSKIDSAEGDFKTAYHHASLYFLYRDSLFNEGNTKKSLQAQLQYEFNKKSAEINTAQILKEAAAKRIRNFQYFFTVLFILVAIFLFWNNRQKQKAKRKIEKAYTELKSTQAQLIQSEKMASLGELTAGIAHEIQNPLNFVNNFSEVSNELIDEMNEELNKGDVDEAKAIASDIKQNLEKITHHGKRADAIVKGMLLHSQTSTGKKETTDINKLADEYLRLSYQGFRAKDKNLPAGQAGFNTTLIPIAIGTDFDETIGNINIIPQDIGRVLLNLYNNAFYAVMQKQKGLTESSNLPGQQSYVPEVTVVTKRLNDKIEIKVTDNGNGIPQKIVDKIFQPFFTTKPTGQGTGLGLSLSYDIVKAHSGEIKVETKEGEGTYFIIVLPFN